MARDWFSLGNPQQLEILIMSRNTCYCASETCVHPEAAQLMYRSYYSGPRAEFVEVETDEYNMTFCFHCVLKGLVDDRAFLEFVNVHLSALG